MIDNLHIRFFKTDLLTIDEGWNTRDVQSSFWRFYRNGGDGACLELPDRLYPLRGGRLYFVPAGVPFHCRNTNVVEHFYVHFDVIGFPRHAMRELFAMPLRLPETPALEASVREITREMARGEPAGLVLQCRIKAVLYAGLACCLLAAPPEQVERYGEWAAALEPVLPALEHVEAHLAARLPNQELAACCHLSEDHFIRRFRQCVGQTPTQYILERRVTTAAQLLLFTRHSVEEIAERTGLGNRFYLSRVFARHTGVAPAAYRKASRV